MTNTSFRPSKQFLIRGAIAIGIIAIVLIVQTNWFHALIHRKKTVIAPAPITLGGLVTKDSNGNGIPDWEEELWGLDPTVLYTNGKSNAEIIKEKQEALGVNGAATSAPTDQTDAIAQELFSITTALSQNQNIDDTTLQNIADQLGSSVNVASISNKYSLSNIHTVATTPKSLAAYYTSLNSIVTKAEAVDTSEPDIPTIVQAAETGDYSQLPELLQTGTVYTGIAQKLSVLPTPIGVAQYQLDIINSFAGMSTSFTYLEQMQANSTQAVVGVALYKVYSNRGSLAFINLNQYLVKYGILSS